MRISKIAILIVVLLTASFYGTGSTVVSSAPPDRPNIVFILTDDQEAASMAFMPKLKALLIDQGVSFSGYFTSFALCCPSRATTLRGQYAHNTQILGNQPPEGGFQKFYALGEESSTIATWLQAAGYQTMLVGKYLNGYPRGVGLTYVPPGWSEWYSAVRGNQYGQYNYTLNENGRLVTYGNKPEDYGTDVYARKTTDFIRRMAKENQPFFVYFSVYAPHSPATPAPRHQNLFPDATAPRTPNFNEADVSDKPSYIRLRRPLTSREISQIDELYRKRLQSLQAVDDAIEAMIETLQATGQLEKTYIFFTSDNGFHLGNHRLMMGKIAPYEEDIRVPLIVRGPGVPAGKTVNWLTGNVDLAPTWAELAAAKVPDFLDGRSLVPLLSSAPPSAESWRQAFLLENGSTDRTGQAQTGGIPNFRGLRTKDYLYVEYVTGERELYELTKDPQQLQNSHASADPALRSRLSVQLEELKRCAGESCRQAESVAVADAPALPTDQAGAPVSVRRDVVYGTVQSVELKLDVYQPLMAGPLPAILFVHGGGWVSGDKRSMEAYARYFAQRGYVGFSVNYRLAPQFKFPAQIEDVKCAVRWVRAQAAELGVNPDRIGALGSSAGGHLVGLLGTTDGSEGLEGSCGDLSISSRVQAVVPYFGPMDLMKLLGTSRGAATAISLMGTTCEANPEPCKKNSPITHVSADDPPFLLVHGTRDPLVPFEQSVLMRDALKAADVEANLVAIEGAGHGWPINSPFGERALQEAVPFFERHLKPPSSDCSETSVGFVPLNDLGSGLYQGFIGGLYPQGANARPEAPESVEIARKIQPLGRDGQPDAQTGKIVLISIGMSNTTQEFSVFQQLADRDPEKNPKVVLIDGAQGGWSADRLVANGEPFWTTVHARLARAGLTPQQVQVAWLKQAHARPRLSFPEDARRLQSDLKIIVQTLQQRFPNIKIVYLSSRIYGGYASTDLNPEPYAYQSGFAVKWLIEEQLKGSAELNFDPAKGGVKAPWLSWGPYLWADGLTPRSDGLFWECADFANDGTHPSPSGRMKVAQLLLKFFKSDATATPWFLKAARTLSHQPQVLRDRVFFTTSPDGLTWGPATLLSEKASVPDLLRTSQGVYWAYWVDFSNFTAPRTEKIAVARSADGRTWEKLGTVQFKNLGSRVPVDPDVIELPDGRLRMYFYDITQDRGEHPIYSAISSDGLHYDLEPGIRFTLERIFDPDVIKLKDGRYRMYLNNEGRIISATSADGLSFVLDPGVRVERGGVPGAIVLNDGSVRLYGCGISAYKSADGLNFSFERETNIRATPPAIVCDPAVTATPDGYLMVYKYNPGR
jgi:arylsulfatase A-like enzyme/dienelactone hydrolase